MICARKRPKRQPFFIACDGLPFDAPAIFVVPKAEVVATYRFTRTESPPRYQTFNPFLHDVASFQNLEKGVDKISKLNYCHAYPISRTRIFRRTLPAEFLFVGEVCFLLDL
jgi:hypothetical protein